MLLQRMLHIYEYKRPTEIQCEWILDDCYLTLREYNNEYLLLSTALWYHNFGDANSQWHLVAAYQYVNYDN